MNIKKIHDKSFLIDAHLDLGGIIYNRRKMGLQKILENEFLDDLKHANFKLVIAAIYIETELTDLALREALLQIQAVKEDINECDDFVLITNKTELQELNTSNKIGIMLSLEGAEPIHRHISLLDIFYDLGVRALGLVWSRRNFVADGSYFRNPEEGIKGGLTPFGIQVIKRAEDLGMIIDVSHLNDTGFQDLLKYSNKRFIASHSNARSINDMVRNLTDDQIKHISDRKGVIGINAYTSIVSQSIEEQTIEKLCDHLEHIIKIGGEDCVGLGFDFCTPYYNNGKQLDVMKNHAETLKITEILLTRGFSEETIVKILGNNFYDFLIFSL